MTQTQQRVGALPTNAKVLERIDLFADTLYFIAGLKEAADEEKNLVRWDIGPDHALAGIFQGLRTSKTANHRGDFNTYACIEGFDGAKFRVKTPAGLKGILKTYQAGAKIVLTYMGVESRKGNDGKTYEMNVCTVNEVETAH